MLSDHREGIVQTLTALPSVGAIATYLAGVPIEKWAAVGGLFFLAMQAAHLLWRWRRDIRRDRLNLPPAIDQ